MSQAPAVSAVANPVEGHVSYTAVANPVAGYAGPQATLKTWPPKAGYPRQLLVDPSQGKEYLCNLCGDIPKEACELICAEHSFEDSSSDDDEKTSEKEKLVFFCKECIEGYVKSTGDKCPLTNHAMPKWQGNSLATKIIGRLQIICPNAMGHSHG